MTATLAADEAALVGAGRDGGSAGDLDHDRDRWVRVRAALVATFVVGYGVWFWRMGLIIDRISVTISVVTLLVVSHVGRPLRRWGALGIEIAVYVLMWFAYEHTRGAADSLGMPLQVELPRNIDRALFFGADPTVWMQQRWYDRTAVHWYDVVASMTYYSHFLVPPAVITVLWVARRSRWAAFMRRFGTVLAVACVSFVLLPTAPPWMASGSDRFIRLDALPSLARHAGRGWRHVGLQSFVHRWEGAAEWANRTAAMPSLHAAFPMLIVAFFWRDITRWWLRALLLVYPIAMCVSLVYFAEHYVADEIGAALLVWGTFVAWRRIEAWRSRRNDTERESQQPRNTADDEAEAAIIGT